MPCPMLIPGKARRNARGKGIHRGAQHTGSCSQQDHTHRRNGIIARRHHHRQQQRIKRNGFLGHAEGGTAQGKSTH